MKLIDITQAYEPGMKRYGSIADFEYEWLRHYDKGSGMAISRVTFTSHLGTHVDAPYHFLKTGRRVDEISLEILCGNVRVIDARGRKVITEQFLRKQETNCSRLIFLTDNTDMMAAKEEFENVYFSPEACRYMAGCGVQLIGIDYFSVDAKGDKKRLAHMPLLQAGIVILEGLVLRDVEPGVYELWCLPLKFRKLEAAPCRAVLISPAFKESS